MRPTPPNTSATWPRDVLNHASPHRPDRHDRTRPAPTRHLILIRPAALPGAAAGFAVADPDYLGLGTGPGLHPWMDVPSETTAALDMLRAARAYVTSHGGTLHRQVLITGFSQGASAALGLGRALQDGADPWFRPGALAPISGAYDFGGAALPSVLDTAHCQAWFAAQGARVPAVNLGTPDYQGSRHYGSNVTGTAQIVRWFLRPADS